LGLAKFWRFENLVKHQSIDPGGEASIDEKHFLTYVGRWEGVTDKSNTELALQM
jgi:hypothetical protein